MGKGEAPQKNGKRIRRRLIAAAILVLLLAALFRLFRQNRPTPEAPLIEPAREQVDTSEALPDTIDTISAADTSMADTVALAPPATPDKPPAPKASRPDAGAAIDTSKTDSATHDTADRRDSLLGAGTALDPCQSDTLAPWVYPDPSGGLHYQTVRVHLKATEPCTIEWRLKSDDAWRLYESPIVIEANQTIVYRGRDSCGNQMAARTESYEITRDEPDRCPKDMAFVEIGETRFCIDKYEWPNRKGAKPQAYISIYHAMDSCFMSGKRLCTNAEWSLACSGPYGWRYPYGDRYESRACNTADTSAFRSGARPECRGYFEIYDMSGNLAEWTDTRARQNRDFYNVAGGFWESGSRADCFDTKYSYFPQNRHNPVGFRCCKDVD